MKALLMTFAVVEFGTGAVSLAAPSLIGTALLGSPLGTTVEAIIARLAGVALVSLALACWLLRNEGRRRAMEGLVGAALLYNCGAVGVLLYAGPGRGLFGPVSGRGSWSMWPWASGASSLCSINRLGHGPANNQKHGGLR